MRSRLRFLARLLRTTIDRWSAAEGPRLGAAFSFYATFSIFPLVLLALTVIGYVLGDDAAARERFLSVFEGSARGILDRTVMTMQERHDARGASAIVSLGSLLFSASGAFVELDTAINRMWGVPDRKSAGLTGMVRALVRERLSGFFLAVLVAVTLLASLVGSSLLNAVLAEARAHADLPLLLGLARTAELAFSITLLSALFVAVFHFVPRSRPPPRELVGGAVLLTVVLTIVKDVFASWLSGVTSYSAYGVAGSVLALALWIYVSTQIVLLGAQLTCVHAEMSKGRATSDAARADRRRVRDREPTGAW